MEHEEPPRGPHPVEEDYTPPPVRRALWYVIGAWAFGAPFFSVVSGAAFTAFLIRYLKASDFAYGLIMAASPAAMVFLFLGSYAAERSGRIKRSFLIFSAIQRLSWLGVAAIAAWTPNLPAGVRLALVGAIVFLSQAAANYGGAGWSAWMSALVPKTIAGRYFGVRARVGMASMVVVSTSVVYLLQRLGSQGWVYGLVFAVAAVLGTLDILLFVPVPEIPRAAEGKPPTLTDILVTPWRNRVFRSFATYTAAVWFGYVLVGSFVWRFCFDPVRAHGLGLSVLQAHLLLVILPVAIMAWASPVWGHAIDRFGPKPVLVISSLAAVFVPLGWSVAHPGVMWLVWATSAFSGLTWPGAEQVNFYMIVKGFPDERRTAFTAAFQCVLGLAVTLGTVVGGVLAAFWQAHLHQVPFAPPWLSHYQPVFFTSTLLRLGAFIYLLLRVHLGGTTPYGTVAREIAADLSNSLPGGKSAARRLRRRGPR
ncbi:MAG: MFS transporter [Armatimonadetes bacterium]|nr:MFS transporter [Armatimonadota bacterium]